MKCVGLVAGLLLATPILGRAQQAVPDLETTVGMRVRVDELPLPGSQLRATPVPDPGKADAILRVINVFPHGSGFRYNLEVTPMVAGTLDLRDLLERIDGSSTDDLPSIPVRVQAVLPYEQIKPNDIGVVESDRVGGYRTWQIIAGVLWILGLVAILFVGRRRLGSAAARERRRPPTLAERLRPLVEQARQGQLSTAGRAELERLLLAHWRRRRNLENVTAGSAIATLHQDPEAGALLRQLEEWLHRPDSSGSVDIAALLEPYRNAPDEKGAGEPA